MVLDPRWIAAPPEIVALIFEGGPGPGSVVAYAGVMATEAAGHQMSASASAANIAATSAQWMGLAGAANAAKGAALNLGGLEPLAAHCAKHVLLAQAAADAYTMAAPSVIPSVACEANRALWGLLNATNWFGQNTPGIIAQDLQYFGEYWPQNSSVGVLYASTLGSIAAAASVPPPPTVVGASPVAPAAAAGSVAQSAANAGATDAVQAPAAGVQAASSAPADVTGQLGSLLQQGPQLVSGLSEPLKGAANVPAQGLSSVAGPAQTLMGMFLQSQAPAAAGMESVAAPLGTGGAATGALNAAATGAGAPGLGYSGAGLTSFTQPTSTFAAEPGGRPAGRAGVLNAAELRGPTTRTVGGAPMPVAPAGMLAKANADPGKEDDVPHARIVVDTGERDPEPTDS
ncbi:PPE domain-containing protein [Mycobacterium sp.]|uniref:PPE domain-containing protein n=1 Tax=Mycobacterium sp. TaxID=1785 RepID=UPI00127522D3|nr:PPE domain-containing protein [Mycobacterium sp.]KAA8969791.1 MAG: PPE domain-containing protein [Mycobacterium sp.]